MIPHFHRLFYVYGKELCKHDKAILLSQPKMKHKKLTHITLLIIKKLYGLVKSFKVHLYLFLNLFI